jgi:methionine synthase II (cobalamin-independent)
VLIIPGEMHYFLDSGGIVITGIGSFPFNSVDEAIDLIFSTCGEVPFWPQLPKRSPLENMYTTFLEGIPSIVSDTEKNTVYVDTKQTEGIEKFYDDVAGDDIETFRITNNVAPGFFRFLERLKEIREGIRYIKCQVTGPFSMGLGLKDEDGAPIVYNTAFYDIIKKAVHMKARWMIHTIQNAYPEKDIIIFFDEPYMVSFGSAYVSVSKDDTISALNEVTEGLKAKTGIHICGNTDWSVPFNSSINIVNYDAYNYLDTIFYYPDDLARFLSRGGQIAPGIVPSVQEDLAASTLDILEKRVDQFLTKIQTSPGATPQNEFFITTSCGVGSLSSEEARTAMDLLHKLDHKR